VEQSPGSRSKRSIWARDEQRVAAKGVYRNRMGRATSSPPTAERLTTSSGNEMTDMKGGSPKVHVNLLQKAYLEPGGVIWHESFAINSVWLHISKTLKC
jgi:hypothetical protein